MMRPLLYSSISVIVVSAIPLFAFSFMRVEERKLKTITGTLVGLAIGAMMGDVVFHIFPEATEDGQTTFWLFGLLGVAIFFAAEKLIHWHHHAKHEHTHPVGKLILLGDALHNFVDGLLITGTFLTSAPLGIATTLAVILHEIPQEIGDFAVLLHAGYSKTRAILVNFLSACAALVGVAVGAVSDALVDNLPPLILSLTAGGFIYVSLADLLPWVSKRKESLRLFSAMFFLGLASMYALKIIE